MSDFKALAKHSTNYLFAIMATKALAFISIPVYTRLLSVYISAFIAEQKGCDSIFCAKLSGFLSIGDIYVMYGN